MHSTQADHVASSLPALRPIYEREEEGNKALLDLEGVRLESGRGRTRITDILGEVAGKQAAESIGIDPQIRDGGLGDRSHGETGQMELPL